MFSRDLPQGDLTAVIEFNSEEEQLLRRCKELVTENLTGLFGNPVIANKHLLVESAGSDSGEEYDLKINDGGTAKYQTLRQTMLTVISASTEML